VPPGTGPKEQPRSIQDCKDGVTAGQATFPWENQGKCRENVGKIRGTVEKMKGKCRENEGKWME